MLIGVVGLNGSGKDSVAQYLVEKYNFTHVDLGNEVRKELARLGRNPLDRSQMRELGDGMRRSFGHNYWAKKALEKYLPGVNFVITSLRHNAEAELIKSRGGIIIEVFANLNVRYVRTVARTKGLHDKHGDVASFEEFVFKENRELADPDPARMQITKCLSMAEYRLNNTGTVDDLHKEVDELLLKQK
ncbi:MAG: AAA family ATPase [Candidatus Diapherotrites archaeon]|nr:AAA family ATPase [Candidatus Diapherotrites archaeon]